MRHILESQQFDRQLLEQLFMETKLIDEALNSAKRKKALRDICRDRLLFTLFFEPSTRTRFSFESAATHLGMRIIDTESAGISSSEVKGERLDRSIRNLCTYRPDAIVLRYHRAGGAALAAKVSTVPVINAGDGKGQHPTQALLDIYTIWKELGRVDDITVLIGGDLLNGRTARSLAYMLGKFDRVRIIFVSPKELRMGDDVLSYLKKHGVEYLETDNLTEVLGEADVVYWTRTQLERMNGDEQKHFEAVKKQFVFRKSHLSLLKPSGILLHPQPIADEIEDGVDESLQARYFAQSANGLPLRMVLLVWVQKLVMPRYY